MFIIDWLLWYIVVTLCTFFSYLASSVAAEQLKMTNTQGNIAVALCTGVGLYVGLTIAA